MFYADKHRRPHQIAEVCMSCCLPRTYASRAKVKEISPQFTWPYLVSEMADENVARLQLPAGDAPRLPHDIFMITPVFHEIYSCDPVHLLNYNFRNEFVCYRMIPYISLHYISLPMNLHE